MGRISGARIAALIVELRERGDEDLAAWVARAQAREEKRRRRRRGARTRRRRKVRIRLRTGKEVVAWIPEDVLREQEEG